MKRRLVIAVTLLGLLGVWAAPACPRNPFTSRPQPRENAAEPVLKSPLLTKIVLWQHQLKQHMSALIRDADGGKRPRPLLALIGLAVLYGAIHAAGPGHGKTVAMTYVLSHRATLAGGLFFGLSFALIHAFSGVAGVLGLRYVIQRSASETLVSVTDVTQAVSFGLITLLGLCVLWKHGRMLVSAPLPGSEASPEKTDRSGLVAWSLSVGLVPCPAVFMIVLFCMSMDAMLLGLVLAAGISFGMAATISLVVMAVVMGKAGGLRLASSKSSAAKIEAIIGVLSGGAIAIFGALFLMASIHAFQ